MALIQYLSRISFEFGAISELGDRIAELGLKRPLLVTDKGIAKAGIEVDRKVLADLAVREPESFKALVEQARAARA